MDKNFVPYQVNKSLYRYILNRLIRNLEKANNKMFVKRVM